MNLRLNPPRAAQAARINRLAFLPPPAPIGFWRWVIRQVLPAAAVVCWFAGFGAWLFAVASS